MEQEQARQRSHVPRGGSYTELSGDAKALGVSPDFGFDENVPGKLQGEEVARLERKATSSS